MHAAHWGSGTTLLVLGLVDVTPDVAVALLCVAVAFEAGTLSGYLCNHLDLSPNFGGAMMGVTNCLASVVAIVAPLLVSQITGEGLSQQVSRRPRTSELAKLFIKYSARRTGRPRRLLCKLVQHYVSLDVSQFLFLFCFVF